MVKKIVFILIALIIIAVGIHLAIIPHFFHKELLITYPLNETLFPPDIVSPTFRWDDSLSGANNWTIRFEFQGSSDPMEFRSTIMEWKPEKNDWETIKKNSLEKNARITILGSKKILGISSKWSSNSISIRTSKDEVGAPIFFRLVPLPFIYAVEHMDRIKWCLGDISSEQPPRIMIEDLPICGNCHSFTPNGKKFGMDVDYANDKGSYVISDLAEDVVLTKDKIITWSDYKKDDGELTFGLLSQVSPDGRNVISTVKDRSVFVPRDDSYYSQLFFPFKGILVYYSLEDKTFHALTGADDRTYVQSNPSWSPDGKYIVFAKNKADLTLKISGPDVVLSPYQCKDYLSGEKKFKFDLCRIPFNEGKGGVAEPIKGASNNELSNYFAKYSPDGKWIVFCRAESFMLLQPDSKLYIMPAEGGEPRLMRCNTNRMNSWHSWSPNSRWLVFSSKVNTAYTQLFLTHIDENGNDTPPVLLAHFTPPNGAANIPEFVNIKYDDFKKMHEGFIDDYSYFRAGYYFDYFFGDHAVAEANYLKSLELNPENINSHSRLGSLYMKQKDYDKAEVQFKAVLKDDPKNSFAHNELGNIYKERGDYANAEKEFREFMKYDPTNFHAYHNLGYIYLHLKEFDKAEEVFIDLLKIANKKEKEHKEKVDAVTSASEKDYIGRVHANLGNLYSGKKEFDKAEKEFLKVVEINPQDIKGHLSLGNIYLRLNKNDLALKEYETALNLSPDAPGLKEKVQQLRQMVSKK